MSADKNHEKYLEEIETAVAETTKSLMENEDYNLREAYRKIAQQDVEIKRLKEYQSSDRKTNRNLRAQLAEAPEELTKLFAENEDLTLRAPNPVEYYDNIIGNLQEKVDGYDCICKEYIGDTDECISPSRLRNYVDDKTDEICALEATVDDKDEEIEKLKKKNEEWAGVMETATAKIQRKYDELEEEYFEKEAELDKYKTWIHCVWSDLYWADKYGREVSFKDISASCDYYDNEDYVKKEVVDDDDA